MASTKWRLSMHELCNIVTTRKCWEILYKKAFIYLHGGTDELLQWWDVVWIGEHGKDCGEVKMTTDQPLQVHQNVYNSRERERERERINISTVM